MRNTRRYIASILLASIASITPSMAQELPHAGNLFPKETQGYVRVAHLPHLSEHWEKTQLGILSKLPGMSAFWEEQSQEIEGRLADAGWQHNLQPQDIYKICGGQLGVAWIERTSNVRKPYAVGVVVDTIGHDAETTELLARIEKDLKQRNGSIETINHSGLQITKATAPKKAGEVLIRESFYCRADQQLLVSDDLETIKGMADALKSSGEERLAKSEIYVDVTSKLKSTQSDIDVDYFVRPIGFAKIMRSISKKTGTRQMDMLKVLEKQGFGKIQAARGQISLGGPQFDFHHESFIQVSNPRPEAVKILDFPNESNPKVPEWASSDTASLTSICWNIKDAFWKVEGIVDEVANAAGSFEGVIEGILTDPTGPQIDLKKEVMPYLTSEIYSLTDCVEPITPDSKRSLIAIRVTDSEKMTKVVNRFMKIEHEARAFDFEGVSVWVVSHDAANSGPAVDETLSDFPGDDEEKKEDEEEPWLNRWAIAVHKDYILFSSHPEYLTDTIKTFKNPSINGQLQTEAEIARGLSAIEILGGKEPNAIWQVNRSSRSFQMQYELFRQDKLPQSRSMVASLMDRLLRPKTEAKDATQRVKGDRLPEFKDIQKYLMPTGMVMKSEVDGWQIQSFILGPSQESDTTTTARTAERSDESVAGQATSGGSIR